MSLFSYCLSRENTRSRRWRNAALLRRKSSRVESNQPQIRLLQSSKLSSGFIEVLIPLLYAYCISTDIQLPSHLTTRPCSLGVHYCSPFLFDVSTVFKRWWRMDLLIVFIERTILSFSVQLEPSCEPTYAHWSAMKHAAGTSPLKRDEIAGGVRKIRVR